MTWLYLFLGVLALAGLTILVVVYLPFARSPEKAWRDRVGIQMAQARRLAQSDRADLKGLADKRQGEERLLRENAFYSFLNKIPVEQLEEHRGIGPATISKLREAGFSRVAALHNAFVDIPGLGKKRLGDVTSAVKTVTKQAQQTFAAGNCPEARELNGRLSALAAKYQELEQRAHARLQSAESIIEQLQERDNRARQITAWTYWQSKATLPVSPQELEAPLPSLDDLLQRAEAQPRAAPTAGVNHSPGTAPEAPMASATAAPPVAIPVLTTAATEVPVAIPVSSAPQTATAAPKRTAAAKPAPRPSPRVASPATFTATDALDLTVQFAYAVARVDAPASTEEKEIIRAHLERYFAQDPPLQKRAPFLCASYETAAIDLEACMHRIAEHFSSEHRAALLDLACHISAASPGMKEPERYLQDLAGRLDVPRARPFPTPPATEKRTTPFPLPSRAEQLAVLEIDPATPLSADLVRRQFNLLSERYTPEKMQSMGRDFVAMAQGKHDAIRAAAIALIEPFGEKLERETPPVSQELRHNPDLDAMFGV